MAAAEDGQKSATAAGLVAHQVHAAHEHRNERFRPKVRVERPAPPDAIGDDHQHVDRALDIRVFGNVAAPGCGVEHVGEPFPDVGIEARRDPRDLRVAPGLGHDLGAELQRRQQVEVMMRLAFEHDEQALRQVGPRDPAAISARSRSTMPACERLLGRKVAIQIAGAHTGLSTDLCHRGFDGSRTGQSSAGRHKIVPRRSAR
jgi:hypothetical protein